MDGSRLLGGCLDLGGAFRTGLDGLGSFAFLAAGAPPELSPEILSVLCLLVACLVLFVTELVSVDVVSILAILVLCLSGVLGSEEALSGFGHPAVIGVGALFVVSEGLLRTGALGVVANRLERWSGGKETRFLALMLGVVLVSSAFLNNTPVVAMFIPVVLGISHKIGVNPSRLLIPLSYAAVLGGTCTLIGTSTNIVVSETVRDYDHLRDLRMFEFTLLGAILSAVGLVYLIFFARRILPERQTITTLTSQGGGGRMREYATELEVRAGGQLVGHRFDETPLADATGVRVLQLIRGEEILWPPFTDTVLEEGDALVIAGSVEDLIAVREERGLATLEEILAEGDGTLANRETELAEVLVQSNSNYAGQRLGEVQLRRRFGVEVVAILRHGMHLRQKLSEHPLRVGDVLLVQGTPEGLTRIGVEDGLVLLSGVEDVRIRSAKAPIAIAILVGVIGLLATGTPMALAALLGALCMIITGCLPPGKVYEAVHWRVLVLIAGMLALGTAMNDDHTLAARWVAQMLVTGLEFIGPHGMVVVVLVLSAILTEVVSNNAVAAVMVPIAVSLSQSLEIDGAPVSPYPFIFAVAYGASCSFLTPIGYQTNTLVYGAGGYRFSDFFRVGLPLVLIVWTIGGFLIPVLWPLVP